MQEPTSTISNDSTDQNSDSSVNRRFAVEDLNDSLHAQTVARAQPNNRACGASLDLQHDCIHVRYDNALIGVETVVEALKMRDIPATAFLID